MSTTVVLDPKQTKPLNCSFYRKDKDKKVESETFVIDCASQRSIDEGWTRMKEQLSVGNKILVWDESQEDAVPTQPTVQNLSQLYDEIKESVPQFEQQVIVFRVDTESDGMRQPKESKDEKGVDIGSGGVGVVREAHPPPSPARSSPAPRHTARPSPNRLVTPNRGDRKEDRRTPQVVDHKETASASVDTTEPAFKFGSKSESKYMIRPSSGAAVSAAAAAPVVTEDLKTKKSVGQEKEKLTSLEGFQNALTTLDFFNTELRLKLPKNQQIKANIRSTTLQLGACMIETWLLTVEKDSPTVQALPKLVEIEKLMNTPGFKFESLVTLLERTNPGILQRMKQDDVSPERLGKFLVDLIRLREQWNNL